MDMILFIVGTTAGAIMTITRDTTTTDIMGEIITLTTILTITQAVRAPGTTGITTAVYRTVQVTDTVVV